VSGPPTARRYTFEVERGDGEPIDPSAVATALASCGLRVMAAAPGCHLVARATAERVITAADNVVIMLRQTLDGGR